MSDLFEKIKYYFDDHALTYDSMKDSFFYIENGSKVYVSSPTASYYDKYFLDFDESEQKFFYLDDKNVKCYINDLEAKYFDSSSPEVSKDADSKEKNLHGAVVTAPHVNNSSVDNALEAGLDSGHTVFNNSNASKFIPSAKNNMGNNSDEMSGLMKAIIGFLSLLLLALIAVLIIGLAGIKTGIGTIDNLFTNKSSTSTTISSSTVVSKTTSATTTAVSSGTSLKGESYTLLSKEKVDDSGREYYIFSNDCGTSTTTSCSKYLYWTGNVTTGDLVVGNLYKLTGSAQALKYTDGSSAKYFEMVDGATVVADSTSSTACTYKYKVSATSVLSGKYGDTNMKCGSVVNATLGTVLADLGTEVNAYIGTEDGNYSDVAAANDWGTIGSYKVIQYHWTGTKADIVVAVDKSATKKYPTIEFKSSSNIGSNITEAYWGSRKDLILNFLKTIIAD
jgi:hypothetical protein